MLRFTLPLPTSKINQSEKCFFFCFFFMSRRSAALKHMRMTQADVPEACPQTSTLRVVWTNYNNCYHLL